MSLEEKLEEVLKNQTTIINMLTDLLEGRDNVKRPNIAAIMEPMINNPIIQANPAVKSMLDNFTKELGGK